MFTVDGMQWSYPCDIDRVAEMQASDISGLLLNKQYFNDVIGTFLKYTVTIVVPFGKENDYVRLYNVLTDPVDAHSFSLPYDQGSISITGRVTDISDVYRKLADGSVHWRGIKFTVISNSPTKTHTLSQVITRGISPMPDVAGAQVGQTYTYNGHNWVDTSFENADEKAY